MPTLLKKTSNRIYKYYPPNENSYDALVNKYFWFSKRKLLNDPYDLAGYVKNVYLPNEYPNWYSEIDNYASCSFNSDPLSKLMWAFYAQNYSGWCLSFPKNQVSTLNLMPLEKVKYAQINKNSIGINDTKQAFLLKDKIWKYEKEYRIVDSNVSKYCENGTKHIWHPNMTDIEIIIGFNISDIYRRVLCDIAEERNYKLYYLSQVNHPDKAVELQAKKIG